MIVFMLGFIITVVFICLFFGMIGVSLGSIIAGIKTLIGMHKQHKDNQ